MAGMFFHKILLLQGFFCGGEGGITRRCAPRPFGAALAGVIPASLPQRRTDRNRREFSHRLAEREGLTRAFGPRPSGDACASSKIAFGDFVEPPFPYLGFESPLRGCDSNLNDNVENLRAVWRRGRDYSALRASPFGPP